METNDSFVLQRASEWMANRGWKRFTAKRRQFDQSLFEHTLVELDAMLQLLPILREPKHFALTTREEQVLAVSIVAHDVGKERPEWQRYILGQGAFVSDVNPVLTQAVVPELCTALGFPGLGPSVISVIENCVNLHMSHERTDANLVVGLLQGTDRWLTLANLVYHVDNVASAKGVLEAKTALERSLLARHVRTAYHQVSIRGVSTSMLHRAALDTFAAAGWAPLIHFGDGTLYICSAATTTLEPRAGDIEAVLADTLSRATQQDVARLMVGSPVGNVLPKPDLFDHREIKAYLQTASRKIGRAQFARKKETERRAVIRKYLQRRGRSYDEVPDDLLAKHSERISSGHPDMMVFKFFKAAMGEAFLGRQGVAVARREYDAVFGDGAWDMLQSTITLDAARDMACTVDRFCELPGERFGLTVDTVEELDPGRRSDLLIKVLTEIARRVYGTVSEPPTRDALARRMAAAFIEDLTHPAEHLDLTELARAQAQFYAASKPVAGKQSRGAQHVCPICNRPFGDGTKASADFLDKPESHTNRAVAHGAFGYITVCVTCTFERLLRQLLLGDRTHELIVLLPRMNIGPGAGDLLMHKAQALYDRAYAMMVGQTGDPDQRVWLSFTPLIAEKTRSTDICRLTPEELAEAVSYRSGEDVRRKNRRELEKALRAHYEELTAANAEWGTEFATWEAAVEAVRVGEVDDQTARRIRAQVYKLQPQMGLVCQTPHLIMMPLSYEIALGEDADTNQALRRVFIALLLGMALDASVAIVRDSETVDFQGGEGVAYVPPVASARSLIGANWVPVSEAERWFRAIGLASIIAGAADYSERSSLYQVLIAPTVGHILRRIEQKRAREKRVVVWNDIECLRAFEEVKP